jgi:hypothetical protein
VELVHGFERQVCGEGHGVRLSATIEPAKVGLGCVESAEQRGAALQEDGEPSVRHAVHVR